MLDLERIFPALIYDNDKKIFLNYIADKGIYLHKQIYDLLIENDESCSYSKLSQVIKYDKGLRNVLFKYLAGFEERYRALLFDNIDSSTKLDNPENYKIEKLNLVKKTNLYSYLYDISYSKYFTLTSLRKTLYQYQLISNKENDDFKDIALLRNKTMHHNLLMTSYHKNIEDVNKEISKIEKWIELLYKYLPEGMNSSFESAINRCNNIGTIENKPNLEILCLREMKNGVFI